MTRAMSLPRQTAARSLRAPSLRPAPDLISEGPVGQRHLAEMDALRRSWRAPLETTPGAIEPSHQSGSFLYAVGRLGIKFPSLSVEKEFFQAYEPKSADNPFDVYDETGLLRLNEDLEDADQALHNVLYTALFSVFNSTEGGRKINLYIARDMCWLMRTLEGRELFLIEPPSDEQLELLIAALKPGSGAQILTQAFIGQELPFSANPFCARLGLPSALMSTLFSPPVNGIDIPGPGAESLVAAMLALTENEGNTASDRALNWVLANDVEVYGKSSELANNTGGQVFDLVDVRTRTVLGAGHREQVDVIFIYQGASSGMTKLLATCVDVTGEFPYQVSALAPFIGRL